MNPITEGDRTLFTDWPEPKPAKTGALETLIADMQHGATLTSQQLLLDANSEQIAVAATRNELASPISKDVQRLIQSQAAAAARARPTEPGVENADRQGESLRKMVGGRMGQSR